MKFYTSAPTALSDDELDTLICEIEACGILRFDPANETEESWAKFARLRWLELHAEREARWMAAHPEEARRAKVGASQVFRAASGGTLSDYAIDNILG